MIGIAGAIRVAEPELVRTARSVFEESSSAQVVDMSGKPVTVERVRNGGSLCLRWEDHELGTECIEIPELSLVGPDSVARSMTLEVVLKTLGPTANLPSGLEKVVASRALSDEEMSAVFREKSRGVAAAHGQLARKIATGLSLSLSDIVPDSLEYWEGFCGPSPEGLDAEAWLRSRLIPYRHELLKKDIAQGLDICCLGALRDDLAPGAWVEGMADEAVWEALQAVKVQGNPIALLGALDVALYRCRDERFLRFADDAVGVLLENFGGNEQDLSRLFPDPLQLGTQSSALGRRRCPASWLLAADVRVDAGWLGRTDVRWFWCGG